MSKKLKSSRNKAEDVVRKDARKKTKAKIEELWAQYGRLQAEREKLSVTLNNTVQKMRQISARIAKLEKK